MCTKGSDTVWIALNLRELGARRNVRLQHLHYAMLRDYFFLVRTNYLERIVEYITSEERPKNEDYDL